MTSLPKQQSPHMLSDPSHNEDAFVVSLPMADNRDPNNGLADKLALVQSIDIIAPLGNNPRLYGQSAACNALSDIYAMGGSAYTAMNILSFSSCDTPLEVVQEILQGALDKIEEAGALSCGGHTLESRELRFGLSVTGFVPKNHFSQNKNLHAGDVLILTKPLGTGVLSTGIRGKWDNAELAEQELFTYTTRLNAQVAKIIQEFQIEASTDITGFGLIGHSLEMAKASQKTIVLDHTKIPFMDYVLEYAQNGLIPKRCYDNKRFAVPFVQIAQNVPELAATLCHDPQTSGGILLAVPPQKADKVTRALTDAGDKAYLIGSVTEKQEQQTHFISIL